MQTRKIDSCSVLSTKEVFLICLGSLFEWAEYCLFGYFIGSIGQSLFPFTSEFYQHLLTWLLFAAGLLSRFLGIYLFKFLSQKKGQQPALIFSMQTMALATTALALIPSYENIGLLAPVLFFCARLVQGLSLSGEFLLSTLALYHYSKETQKISQSALSLASASLGIILGGIVATLSLQSSLSPSLQWRLPFFLGSLFLLFSSRLRCSLQQRSLPEQDTQQCSFSSKDSLSNPHFLKLFLLFSTLCVDTYLCQSFFSSHLIRLGVDSLIALKAQILGQSLSCLSIILISSFVKEKNLKVSLIFSLCAIASCAFPFFLLAPTHPFIAQTLFGLSYGSLCALILGYTCSLFPSYKERYLGLALPWSLAVSTFGALSPSFCLFLQKHCFLPMPGAWLIFLLSLSALMSITEWFAQKKISFFKKLAQ